MSQPTFFGHDAAEHRCNATGRFLSPGDITRKATARLRNKSAPKYVRPKPEKKSRPNPYRQPIGTEDELEFRHLNWAVTREKIGKHMVAAGVSSSAMDRWRNCGAECVIEWSESLQRYRLRGSYCHSRHCRPCARTKALLITKNLANKLTAEGADCQHKYKFLTLTFRGNTTPLKSQLTRAYACLRKLRATSMWKNNVNGGSASLESKWKKVYVDGKPQSHWHPHFHIIYDGDPIDQARLSKAWHDITGDSFMVDIKQVKSTKDAAFYVSKYITKGVNDDMWDDPEAAKEWINATAGLRVCATFGSWRGFRLTQVDVMQLAKDWTCVGILDTLCQQVRAGSEHAMILMRILRDAVIYDPSRRQKKAQNTS